MSARPNYLFLFSDQHRGDWMPYNSGVKQRLGVSDLVLNMPNIRKIMERGTSFTCALTPAPICAPARACLAAGRRYRNCRVATNNVNYDHNLESFYGKLSSSGYYVSGVGKFDLNKADLYWGDGYHEILQKTGFSYALDSEGKMDAIWAAMENQPGPYGKMLAEKSWLEKHVDDMMHRMSEVYPTPLPDELYADNWITQRGIELIQDAPKDQPWFFQINFSGPHDPWDITESMKSNIEQRRFPDAADCTITEKNQPVRQNYAAMIENIDRNIGRLIEAVAERGDLKNTIIIYSSDHGEMMGDHNLYGKAKPQQGSVHIPMVIDASYFNGVPNQTITSPVELQDLAATFLDYAGLPTDSGLESVSLKPVLSGQTDKAREYGISELINPNPGGLFNTFGVVTDGIYKLILRAGKKSELYNISDDPFECRDIADEHDEIVGKLHKAFCERGEEVNSVSLNYASAFHLGG